MIHMIHMNHMNHMNHMIQMAQDSLFYPPRPIATEPVVFLVPVVKRRRFKIKTQRWFGESFEVTA